MNEPSSSCQLLGLHSPAWTAIKSLLASSGIQVPLGVRLLYGWRSRIHSLTWQVQPRSETQQELPVALLACGFWRSGTTLLHECLANDDRWRAPTTQECMNPGQPAVHSTGKAARRPMDNLVIASDSPQEDEFGLLSLGAPSFYRVLLCPGAWRRLADELAAGSGAESWGERERIMREFFGMLQLRDNRPLLLKSPTHSYALPRLMACAPNAKAVIVIRDWRQLWPSCMRMWEAMFRLYALGPWTRTDIADLTLETYRQYAQLLKTQLFNIADERIAVIRYEDLARLPVETLIRVYRKFGWEFPESIREHVRNLVESTRPDRQGRAASDPAEPARTAELLARSFAEICEATAPYLVAP